MSNRREFLGKAAASTVAAITPVWLSAKEADQPFLKNKVRVLRFAHLTDVHLLPKKQAETCFARVLRELNTMKDKPSFIVNTGDSLMEQNNKTREDVEASWELWKKIVKAENSLPMKSALGNHDVWWGPDATTDATYKSDKRYGKGWTIEVLSMPGRHYSFQENGWKFIALDSIHESKNYLLDEAQFSWLENELKTTLPVCIYSHVPILSMAALIAYTKRNPLDEVKFPYGTMHSDHQRIKDLFYKNGKVKLCLSGHVHYADALQYLDVKYLCNGAVSGNWWNDPLTYAEFPPAYTIVDLYDDGTSEHRLIWYDTTA
jgi:3',5'-cyclic AMP phosphodiesterase CpdA